MREIKFRAWDINKKVMTTDIYTSTVEHNINNEFYYAESGQSGLIYLQYTGLKDKSGVEIYEGDICIHENTDGEHEVVYWNDGEAGFFLRGGECESWMCTGYEIIGNIHENPELLEVKQ